MSTTNGTAGQESESEWLIRRTAERVSYAEGGWLPEGATIQSLTRTAAATPAKPITVSDVEELQAHLRVLRGRVHALFNDDRLSHTQSAAVAALVDAFNATLSAAYVVRQVTS